MDAEYRQAWNDWDDRECENDRYECLVEDIEHWMKKYGWWRDYDLGELAESADLEWDTFDILWTIYTKQESFSELGESAIAHVNKIMSDAIEDIAVRYVERHHDDI